jgi:hypothetical protein
MLNNAPQSMPQVSANDGGFAQMIQEFQQFRNTFRGNAKQEVERLLQSGQMTQQQFQQLSQMANQMMGLMSR